MKRNEIGSDVPGEPEDLFERANLYPGTTGLPMTVWVSPRGNAHHELRVRVNVTHGNQIDIADTQQSSRFARHLASSRASFLFPVRRRCTDGSR